MTDWRDTGGRMLSDRVVLPLLGAAAGFATWALYETWDGSRLALFLSAFVIGAFAVFFGLSGPARRTHALIAAVALVLPAALLLVWASTRFDRAETLLNRTPALADFVAILVIGMPFVAAALREPGGWRRYPLLFDIAWMATVRYGAAWLFTGAFWVLVYLSDQLLRIVGIDLLHALLREDAVPYVMTGAVLGLALAVAHELRDYISPFFVLRLLRVLLPPVLAVALVFIVALLLRGLSAPVRGISVAMTLLGTTMALVTLATAALDRDAAAAVSGRVMRLSVRLAALVAPVLAGAAVVALWLRVAQYGWTPSRVNAGCALGVTLLYGLGYGGAALWAGDWAARLRQVNLGMALVTLTVALVWLTPLLDPQRISARDQLARILDGRTPVSRAPVWELAREWGRAGAAALERLETGEGVPEPDTLRDRIERARSASSVWAFRNGEDRDSAAPLAAEVRAILPVRPEGAALSERAFDGVPLRILGDWKAACTRRLPGGYPACVAVVAPFLPGLDGEQIIVLTARSDRQLNAQFIVPGVNRGLLRPVRTLGPSGGWPVFEQDDIARILDGDFAIVPSGISALSVGDRVLVPDN